MSKPDESHYKALENIWFYLNKYPNTIIYYNCDFPITYNYIKGYTDSSYANSLDNRKLTSRYYFYLYTNIIS